jgi:hypothetical protein
MQLGTGHRPLLRRSEFGWHENVRRLVGVGAGTPDAPEHPLEVAISVDQLGEMLCAEFQAGSAREHGNFLNCCRFEGHGRFSSSRRLADRGPRQLTRSKFEAMPAQSRGFRHRL